MVTLRNRDEGQLTCLMGNRLDMQIANNWDIRYSTGEELWKKYCQTSMTMCYAPFFSEMKTFFVGGKSLKTQDIKGELM